MNLKTAVEPLNSALTTSNVVGQQTFALPILPLTSFTSEVNEIKGGVNRERIRPRLPAEVEFAGATANSRLKRELRIGRMVGKKAEDEEQKDLKKRNEPVPKVNQIGTKDIMTRMTFPPLLFVLRF